MRSSLGEVGSKTVASYIFHLVFIWERRDGAGSIFLRERLVEEDEVCEAAANAKVGFLERFKICLMSTTRGSAS